MGCGRRELAERLLVLWRAVHNKRYYVKRGAINWTSHLWDKHPFAVSVGLDDSTFLRPQNHATVSFEIFTKLKDPSDAVNGYDEVSQDDLLDDAVQVIQGLSQAVDANGDFIADVLPMSDNAIEAHDTSLGVQGLVINFQVGF